MQFTIILVLFCGIIGSILAHPMPEEATPPPKYPLNLEGGGGGQRGDGFGFHVSGSENVWRSDNGRHEIDLNGKYGQHLGGPYGNSDPSYQFGANYRFRF
ncbi:hypothetical protein KR026_004128 [Drosophila bipectinata]|nr:hypothetical protein KR026_004128 [Drosophila bipectinata]